MIEAHQPGIDYNEIDYGAMVGGPLSGQTPEAWYQTMYGAPYSGANITADLPGLISGIQTQVAQDAAASSGGLEDSLVMALAGGAMGGMAAGAAGAGGAAGGGGGGTLMPAAIPESASTLSGWGLTQTSPGVWEALNAAGAGAGAGAGGAAGAGTAMPPAVPESAASLSAQGLTQTSPGVWEALGLPSGGSIPNLPSQGMPRSGTPSTTPGAPSNMPPASPATSTPAGTPQGPAGAPQSTGFQFVDDLIKQMRSNPLQALGLGMTGLSLAGGLAGQKGTPESVNQLGQGGAMAQQTAQRLLEQARSGQLSGPQQASLDQTVQNTKNQIRQYFATIGMSDSTAARQAEAAVDREALAMKEQFLNQALTQGLNAIGIASGPLSQAAQFTLGQDRNLQQA